ncbi:hypothetical protein CANINC_001112 [Pichia inconspicua]|uniref:Myb-like domain-containing protein n=1 Tax=Pichia inconspicua TaxID=52247 RepID=A0A4T0X4W2_9ASCO|nr:hypothetical protein CANINC_001112 [[Candida] inconspicua]
MSTENGYGRQESGVSETANDAGLENPIVANATADADADADNEAEKLLEDDEEEDTESAGNGLLESLTTDVAKYHKKVEKKAGKKGKEEVGVDMGAAELDDATVVADKEGEKKEITDSTIRKRVGEDSDNYEDYNESDTNVEKRKKSSKKQRLDRKVVEWSKEEDDAIVYYKEEMKYSWKRIEELLESKHSWQAIQMRYLRNHKSRNEDWSKFMEVKLINAVRKDWENRWRRISAELGKHFTPERCLAKNIDICKKIETDYYTQVFQNKEFKNAYLNPLHDIKDPEQHKKLLLVYMGLDSISYEDEPDAAEAVEATEAAAKAAESSEKSEELPQASPETATDTHNLE